MTLVEANDMSDNIDPPESCFENAGLPMVVEKSTSVAIQPAEPVALTPQQARIEAVGNVLHKAIEKASTLCLTSDESKALQADFPDEAFTLGAGGDPNLIYIEHPDLRDRFNQVLGLGQWAVIRSRPHWAELFTYYDKHTKSEKQGTRIYSDCALVIRGCFVSEAIGSMDYYPNQRTNFGDAAEGADSAAFRRCAKKFGVGLQAWKKDFCTGWMQRHRNPRPVQVAKPVPKPAPIPETPEQKRQRFIEMFRPYASYALDYWREIGILLPNEDPFTDIEDYRLDKVPVSQRTVDKMLEEVKKLAGVGKPPECPQCKASDYTETKQGNKTVWRCNQCKHEWQSVSGTEQSAGEVLEQLEPKAKPIPEDALSLAGTIMTITEKKGTKTDQQGKIHPWTRYGIKDNNGNWYNTFSDTLGAKAKEIRDSKQTCQFIYTEGKYGRDLCDIQTN